MIGLAPKNGPAPVELLQKHDPGHLHSSSHCGRVSGIVSWQQQELCTLQKLNADAQSRAIPATYDQLCYDEAVDLAFK